MTSGGLDFGLVFRTLPPGQSWKREDVYDGVFCLRLLAAVLVGVGFGALGVQGLPAFIA
jgi:hypothetical protein